MFILKIQPNFQIYITLIFDRRPPFELIASDTEIILEKTPWLPHSVLELMNASEAEFNKTAYKEKIQVVLE